MVVPHKNIKHGHSAYAAGVCRCKKCYGARRTYLAQQARKRAEERAEQARVTADDAPRVHDRGWDTFTRDELFKVRGWD